MEILISIVIFILLFSTIKSGVLADGEDGVYEEVRVGLVADLGSIEGKILQTSLPLALSDIYHINNRYRTRVSVSTRDSQGDPLLALAAGEFQTCLARLLNFFGNLHKIDLVTLLNETKRYGSS